MTLMPTINDRMIERLRRTGKRRAFYATARSSRLVSNGSRVVLQDVDCSVADPGTICWQGPCDPATRTRPVKRCNDSNGCTRVDTIRC
jgi:hypothetical protein